MARLIREYVCICFLSPEPEKILYALSEADVEMLDIRYQDPLSVQLYLSRKSYKQAVAILNRYGLTCEVVGKSGVFWKLSAFLTRPALILSAVFFTMIALWIQGRIFSVQVAGNEAVSERYILQIANECGIRFGQRAKTVRSEQVKNALLQKIPDLQWVGVNTSGSVATIHVRERNTVNEKESITSVSHIVASQDGLVCQVTVNHGTAVCSVGQQVKAGDVLVSGYTDCGLKIQAQNADGEVYAYTERENTVLSILPAYVRGVCKEKRHAYRLRIGKKVINLWNGSGISDATCVKMYLEEIWSLPGDFILPVSLIRETWMLYDPLPLDIENLNTSWITAWAEEYIRQKMLAGEILEKEQHIQVNESFVTLKGSYHCREMIGQVKYEETLEEDAQNH